jgi:light-regulated signal transduction histidine kinase (bacteriophytochrome)
MLEGLGAGADDYISKSSELDVLKARVRAQIRRKLFEDESRRIREQLLRRDFEASEARAARELAETRASMVDELRHKNDELEAFSYSVSHDLRAPLRSIDGFSQALLEDYSDQLDERGQDYLRRVRSAAQRMGELIDDLLELSRVGRAELTRARVNLADVARLVVTELRNREPDRQVETQIESELWAEADRRLMTVALENLLGNAWKFTARSATARIQVASERREGETVYVVRDNGTGFDMNHGDKLFRPFQRLHGAADYPGTGIGLATVHRILDRHGGRIWADSRPGDGATFYFTLSPRRLGGSA